MSDYNAALAAPAGWRTQRWAVLTAGCYAVAVTALLFLVVYLGWLPGIVRSILVPKEVWGGLNALDKAHAGLPAGMLLTYTPLAILALTGWLWLVLFICSRSLWTPRLNPGWWVAVNVPTGLCLGLLAAAGVLVVAEFLMLRPLGGVLQLTLGRAALLLLALGAGTAVFLAYQAFLWFLAVRYPPREALERVHAHLRAGALCILPLAFAGHFFLRPQSYWGAGAATFVALTLGLTVFLFSLGPSTFFMLAGRSVAARAAEPLTMQKRLAQSCPHTLYAVLLAVLAVGLMLQAFGVQVWYPQLTSVLKWLRLGFVLAAVWAAFQAWRAAGEDEPLWGLTLFCTVVWVEFAALASIALWH